MSSQYASQNRHIAANYAKLGCKFRKEFLAQFMDACKALGITQTSVIAEAMKRTIEQAGLTTDSAGESVE